EEARTRAFPQAREVAPARLLSHCTEATAHPESPAAWGAVFAAIGVKLETPATGCCGMAGLFGHQRRHQQVSRRLFEMSWRERLEEGAEVMATGFSCRCQSERLADRTLRHPLGIVARLLDPALPPGAARR
ncbi:MAG: heterodisulfide reductase-related iron-sulfur binding cluster, partial [Cereibacter changlensis]